MTSFIVAAPLVMLVTFVMILSQLQQAHAQTSTPSLVCDQCTDGSVYQGAKNYSILGSSVTNTGTSACTYDIGVSPGTSVAGNPYTQTANGAALHLNDAFAVQAMTQLQTAYNAISTLTATGNIAGDMAGLTTTSGIHQSDAAIANTGIWTFDAQNATNATFVIITGGAYTPAAGSSMVLLNGAQAKNIIFASAGAVSTGAGSTITGTFLASGAITIGASSTVNGRILSLAAVTTTSTTINSQAEDVNKCLCFPGSTSTQSSAFGVKASAGFLVGVLASLLLV